MINFQVKSGLISTPAFYVKLNDKPHAVLLSLSLSLSSQQATAVINPMFYFSVATFVIGVVGALYLLLEWVHHRKGCRFALLWSVGLFLLFWFQVPAILFNAGKGFTLTDFNLFFSFALPTTFIGSLLIYAGILSVSNPVGQKKGTILILWAALATVLFFFYFANRNTITNHSGAYIFIFGFFMPLNVLSLLELNRWRKKFQWPRIASFGTVILAVSFAVRIFQDVYVFDKLLRFPPEFWFLTIANFPTLFIMQAVGTLLVLAGFFLVHKSCCRIVD